MEFNLSDIMTKQIEIINLTDDTIVYYQELNRTESIVTYDYLEFKNGGILKNVEIPLKLADRLNATLANKKSISVYAFKPIFETYFFYSSKTIYIYALMEESQHLYVAQKFERAVNFWLVNILFLIGFWFVLSILAVTFISIFFIIGIKLVPPAIELTYKYIMSWLRYPVAAKTQNEIFDISLKLQNPQML